MTTRYLSIGVSVCAALLLAGCVGQEKRPYYACHFGQSLTEQCLKTDVEADRDLVCVDVTRDTHFELDDCDTEVKKKQYLMF